MMMMMVVVVVVTVMEMQGGRERGEVLLMGPGGAKGPPKGRREGDALVPMRSKEDGEVEWGGCD